MKKNLCRIFALLLTVSILTVSASASFSNCSPVKENMIWKCLMMGQSTCWNKCISVISNQPIKTEPVAACPTAKPSATEAPKTVACPTTKPSSADAPKTTCPTAKPSATEAPETVPPAVKSPEAAKEELPATEPMLPDTTSTDQTILAYESKVIELINQIRKSNGLTALTANADLCRVARYKSQDMLDKNYFSHTSPTYGSPFAMMKSFGISYRTAGENIAYGYPTPEAVVDGWMNSEGHRKNILNSSFAEIGVGYVSNGHYWTQMFIG